MVGLAGEVVVGGVERFVQQTSGVSTAVAVERPPAVATGRHQPGRSEFRQVLGHGGPGDPDRLGQRGDVLLLPAQQPQNPQPGAVGEREYVRCLALCPLATRW